MSTIKCAGGVDSYFQRSSPNGPRWPELTRCGMNKTRFNALWRALYFSNETEEHPPSSDRFDKIYKVRSLVDGLNQAFASAWVLGDKVAVDGTRQW